MPPKDTLGNRVRVARERLGITQVDLARDVGISRQALMSVEKGRMNPSVVVSLKIARILREPVDYLFFIDGRDGEALEAIEHRTAKSGKMPRAAAPEPEPVAAPPPEPQPEPEPTPEPVVEAEASTIVEEPHIVLDPEADHELEPEVDAEPPEAIIVEAKDMPEPEPEPEPEPAPTRHAVPVSAEPEAPAEKSSDGGDEPDDAQLSLF